MKVGIVGTRGIPNQYGGFEQFAMLFSEFLVESGHEVVVYNSSKHPYQETTWKGVEIKHIYDPEHRIGTVGQFIYDYFSILNTRKQNFDIILQLGYTSSSVWGFLFPKKSTLITNMDGLEWKRSKYNKLVQTFLKKAEKWAVRRSDFLIADSIGIQDYLKNKYQVKSTFIPYGAEVFKSPDNSILEKYKLTEKGYNLAIARFEPENNLKEIIEGHLLNNKETLVVIGNTDTKYGNKLVAKYKSRVSFLGSIYDMNILNNLRFFSNLYFHGHSVGGTNPSLLEAMACSCNIIAHDNPFNRAVLNEDASYFKSKKDISDILISKQEKNSRAENNLAKIESVYSFHSVHNKLLDLFSEK
ncbi:MAG: DUF1972 domain-containing protein [Flavobacteriales bacterium]